MFSVITEIGEKRREDIWKNYITKKNDVKKLVLDHEPPDWEPMEIPNSFSKDKDSNESQKLPVDDITSMFLSESKVSDKQMKLPTSKSEKNSGNLPKLTWLEKKLYNLNNDILSKDLSASIFKVLNSNKTNEDPAL